MSTENEIQKMRQPAETQAVAIGIIKILIGAIPVVGAVLNEAVFDTPARVAQTRTENLIRLLQEDLRETAEHSLSVDHLQTDEFSDFVVGLFTVNRQVASESKRLRLSRLLRERMTQGNGDSEWDAYQLEVLRTITDQEVTLLAECVDDYRRNEQGDASVFHIHGEDAEKARALQALVGRGLLRDVSERHAQGYSLFRLEPSQTGLAFVDWLGEAAA